MKEIKTSHKIKRIQDIAWEYMYNGSKLTWKEKMNTKKMIKLRFRFEIESEKLGGLPYSFGDLLG